MGDWNFLGGILEEVHIHSTIVGKIWLTILFIFRMLVLGVAAEDVWNDEQSDFICNTKQPGCRNVCYDRAFPISLIRYWVLQVIFVSSPSLVYMGHALYRLRALEKERQRKKTHLRKELDSMDADCSEVRRRLERELRHLEQRKLNKAPLRGSLLRTYVIHIVTRSAVEVGFMVGQYLLYGFNLEPLFKCEKDPCPNLVDCFVSRPMEKTVFMVFMQCIAAVSLFLNILEIIHLGYKKFKNGLLDYYSNLKDDLDDYYMSKSKKNSVVHQACTVSSLTRKSTIPTAPSGYTLLTEKPSEVSVYPVQNPLSAFMPFQCNPCTEGSKEFINHNLSDYNASKGTEGLGLPGTDTTTPRRVSAPWNCSTVVESNGSNGDTSSVLKQSNRPQTPDSFGESSSESKHSRNSNSPRASSPTRRISLASSSNSSRHAPGDLQI
uniref:Gap junction protein n=1 Tax=Erpetoichthys calabaricus TaxID=27687 RepID=A0A8C4SY41_ERPCA